VTDVIDTLRTALDDRYAVQDLLGAGGMAQVFRATDRKHGRQVAIKVLRPEVGASLGAERFISEIQICASLSHPHILPLYDSGTASSLLYYVMPLVEGESLRDRLNRERQLALDDALHVARGVAAALAYAHARGIVHRDIKPENILLCAGEPIVADFGIAKAVTVAGDTSTTGVGIAVGTPAYMSPEQASGESDVDGRSDIYSLGCVLYEMLSGDPPYTGPTAMAITARKLVEAVPSISRIRETVPPGVERIIGRSLAKAPADRYASAWDLAQALAGGAASPFGEPAFSTTAVRAAEAEAPLHSVAVLPFANMSGNPEDEFFSDGLSEELIHVLGKVDGLSVVARTSAFAFKNSPDDVRAIGRRLNVGSVLEGSVRRSGSRLRVTTQLVKAADGYQLWSERYDRTIEDVFAVQDEIAKATAEALKVTLLGDARDADVSGTRNMRAHELFLRGRHAWGLRTEDGLHASVAYLLQAAELDPDFAQAHAALADAYTTLGLYGALPADDVMPRAEAAAERALALAPELAEALATLACVKAAYRWSWPEAEALFRQAIERQAGYATAHHWFAINCLTPQGRFDEARTELAAALKHDPLNPSINVTVGLVAHFAGDAGAAVEAFRRTIEIDPGFGMARFFLGETFAATGQLNDAIAAFHRAAELTGGSLEVESALAHALALAGRGGEAETKLVELQERAAERHVSPVLLGQVWTGLGETTQALSELERAADQRDALLIWLKVRPAFDPLRGQPRFQALLDRLGLA